MGSGIFIESGEFDFCLILKQLLQKVSQSCVFFVRYGLGSMSQNGIISFPEDIFDLVAMFDIVQARFHLCLGQHSESRIQPQSQNLFPLLIFRGVFRPIGGTDRFGNRLRRNVRSTNAEAFENGRLAAHFQAAVQTGHRIVVLAFLRGRSALASKSSNRCGDIPTALAALPVSSSTQSRFRTTVFRVS